MVGRGPEKAVLATAVAELAAGRGRSLLIIGEPGIGKSVMLEAGLELAGGVAVEVLRGACDELGRNFPLSVMMGALGVDAGAADPARADAAAALLRPGDHGWGVSMLGGDPVVAAVEELLALVDRLCAAGPVVLAVDDLHWADDASLLCWQRLSRATVQLPLLLVGACRPVPQRGALDRLQRDFQGRDDSLIVLDRLADDSVLAMAQRLVGGSVGPGLGERLGLAAGNPLYVRELLDALSRAGVLEVSGGVVEVADHGGPVTGSLFGVVADRLDFLSEETREVLRSASLLGAEFSVGELATMVGRKPAALLACVDEAIAAGVVEPTGAQLRFRHGLLRQALYEAMPREVRSERHRQLAQALMTSGASLERVAQAVLAAVGDADGWELDWLVADAAVLAYRAPQIAAELFEYGLDHAGEEDPRRRVLEDHLAGVAFLLARHEQVEQLTRRILAGTRDPDRIGRTTWLLSYTLFRTGRSAEALKLLAEAVAHPRSAALWQSRLRSLYAIMLLGEGRTHDGAAEADRALAEGERLADPMAMAWGLHACSTARDLAGDPVGALVFIDRALMVAGTDPQLADLRLLLLSNRASALFRTGRADEVADTVRQARELAERTGTPRLSLVQLIVADQALDLGRWDDALAELEQVTVLSDQAYLHLRLHGTAALIAEHRDDQQQADRWLEPLRDHPIHAGWARGESVLLLMARAIDAERHGDLKQATEILSALLTPDYARFVHERFRGLPMLVRTALACGNLETARRATEACEADARALPRAAADADWCRALLNGDPQCMPGIADQFRAAGRQYEVGALLEDAADLLAARGHHDEAREAFAGALEVYTALSAVWDSRRAARRLRRYGIRSGVSGPRRRPRSGWEALTATELRVVGLVAEGCGNPDIAARLMLSRRTVETHVSNILAKLGVHSRRELAELAERRG